MFTELVQGVQSKLFIWYLSDIFSLRLEARIITQVPVSIKIFPASHLQSNDIISHVIREWGNHYFMESNGVWILYFDLLKDIFAFKNIHKVLFLVLFFYFYMPIFLFGFIPCYVFPVFILFSLFFSCFFKFIEISVDYFLFSFVYSFVCYFISRFIFVPPTFFHLFIQFFYFFIFLWHCYVFLY